MRRTSLQRFCGRHALGIARTVRILPRASVPDISAVRQQHKHAAVVRSFKSRRLTTKEVCGEVGRFCGGRARGAGTDDGMRGSFPGAAATECRDECGRFWPVVSAGSEAEGGEDDGDELLHILRCARWALTHPHRVTPFPLPFAATVAATPLAGATTRSRRSRSTAARASAGRSRRPAAYSSLCRCARGRQRVGHVRVKSSLTVSGLSLRWRPGGDVARTLLAVSGTSAQTLRTVAR